jgi:hypothetical protein
MPISLVSQGTNGYAQTRSTTGPITVTLQQEPISGNLLIAGVFSATTGGSADCSFSETGVNWATGGAGLQVQVINAATYFSAIYVGIVGAGASTTVTVTLPAGQGGIVTIFEFSGLATSGFLDKTANDPQDNQDILTGTTATTTQANELCFGVIAARYVQTNPLSEFTLYDGSYYAGYYMSSSCLTKIVSLTGTYGSGTSQTSRNWACACIATFKGAVQIATPTLNPASGTYNSTQSVTISDTQATASIYYTDDGTVPSAAKTLYSAPVSVALSKTLKAIAIEAGYLDSAIASEVYVINLPPTSGVIPTGPDWRIRRKKELIGLIRDYLVMKGAS